MEICRSPTPRSSRDVGRKRLMAVFKTILADGVKDKRAKQIEGIVYILSDRQGEFESGLCVLIDDKLFLVGQNKELPKILETAREEGEAAFRRLINDTITHKINTITKGGFWGLKPLCEAFGRIDEY